MINKNKGFKEDIPIEKLLNIKNLDYIKLLKDIQNVDKLYNLTINSLTYKQAIKKKYVNVENYINYKIALKQFLSFFIESLIYLKYRPDYHLLNCSTVETDIIAIELVKNCIPLYWLKKDLFESFLNTEPPNLINIEIKKVIPHGILFLPQDSDFLFDWIAFRYIGKDDINNFFCTDNIINKFKSEINNFEHKHEYINELNDSLNMYEQLKYIFESETDKIIITVRSKGDLNKYYSASLTTCINTIDFFRKIVIGNTTKTDKMSKDESDIIENCVVKARNIIIQTFLYLQYYSEDKQQEIITINNKSVKKYETKKEVIHTPNWIGENFKIKTIYLNKKEGDTQQGQNKSVHWRRGFNRKQLYGSRINPQYKVVWIKPVLVNGSKENEKI